MTTIRNVTTPKPETARALTVVDKSTKALLAASAGVTKVIQDLADASSIAANLAQDIEFKESALAALEAQYIAEGRRLEADLKLRILENGTVVLQSLLKERGLVSIADVDLKALQTELTTTKSATEAEVRTAVAAVTKELNAEAASKLATLESTHKVAVATTNANIQSLTQTVAFLEKQVAEQAAQIKAERDTRVEIARAESQRQGVTVNTSK